MTDFVLPTGTVTLLLLDAADRVAALHEIVADLAARHRGVGPVAQGDGDSAVVAFACASDAVTCAAELQAASPVPVRIGLHTGEVQRRDEGNDIGAAVNRCARLRDVGHGGQTLLSRTTADLVADTSPMPLVDLGVHRLRDLARPEQIFQLGAGEHPPLRSLDVTPNNLPVHLTSFIGRSEELAQLAKLLGDARLLTVTGAGGCGKTRLAQQAVAAAIECYPDGAWFVDLSSVADGANVASAVAHVLGVREDDGRPATDAIARHLAARRVLLLLDNCEHVVAAAAELAHRLVGECPAVTVLATSREPLGVGGEVTWRVPNLSVPGERGPLHIDALASSDAVRLFIDRARRARPNFAVTNETAPAVAEICQRLDGIPLAIELAAARVRVLSPQQIATGLSDRFRLLGAGPRTAVPRHQTLRASIDSSFDLLGDAERVLFRRLAIFAGGFDLDAAEQVCADDVLDQWQVLAVLAALVDRSLVVADDEGGASRYRLLETIRQYALERLIEAGERDALRVRHLHWFRAFAERNELDLGVDQPRALDALDRDIDNLRAAIDVGLDIAPDDGARICAALFIWYYVRGRYREWADVSARCAEAEGLSDTTRARVLVGLGMGAGMAGDLETCSAAIDRAAELARGAGDTRTAGRACVVKGNVLVFEEPAAAEALLTEGMRIAVETGDTWFELEAHQITAALRAVQGDTLGIARDAEAGLAAAARVRDPDHEGTFLSLLGLAASMRGQFADAERLASRGLSIASANGNTMWIGMALFVLGRTALGRGDLDDARSRFDAMRERDPEHPWLQWMSGLGAVAEWARGGPASAALQRLDHAISLSPGASLYESPLLLARGDLRHAAGDATGARQAYEESLAVARAIPSRYDEGRALAALGRLDHAEGADERAESLLHDALRLAVATEDRPGVVDALEGLAAIARTLESGAEATRLLAAAARLRAEMDYRWQAPDVIALRGTKEWDEGSALTIEDAIAYAQRGRGERKRPSRGWASLTPTELDVVRLVADGHTNAQIAERLFISVGTVKTHVGHVFAKLGVTTRSELAVLASKRLSA